MNAQYKAVFLDRDGVINEAIVVNGKPYSPMSLRELRVPDSVYPVLQTLKDANYLLIVVTNQPDVARKKILQSTVDLMHDYLRAQLPIDAVYVCYHDDANNCACRKPKPGMLLQAAQEHHIDLSRSYLIGDRWKDMQAGQRAGCKTIFIDANYKERNEHAIAPDCVVYSLEQAANFILKD
jgi:D-glycero-D-manno-heptose 1,7-bisphosphate phosphatase